MDLAKGGPRAKMAVVAAAGWLVAHATVVAAAALAISAAAVGATVEVRMGTVEVGAGSSKKATVLCRRDGLSYRVRPHGQMAPRRRAPQILIGSLQLDVSVAAQAAPNADAEMVGLSSSSSMIHPLTASGTKGPMAFPSRSLLSKLVERCLMRSLMIKRLISFDSASFSQHTGSLARCPTTWTVKASSPCYRTRGCFIIRTSCRSCTWNRVW